MITDFGKFLRIIRANTGDSAQIMARKFGMSAAYLSTIENGKRNIPPDMENIITKNYQLSDYDRDVLHKAIIANTPFLKLNFADMQEKRKKVIYSIAKNEIDDETLDSIYEIINNNIKENKL